MATKSDCIYYNWGDTVPKCYGAVCNLRSSFLNEETCENCTLYKKKDNKVYDISNVRVMNKYTRKI